MGAATADGDPSTHQADLCETMSSTDKLDKVEHFLKKHDLQGIVTAALTQCVQTEPLPSDVNEFLAQYFAETVASAATGCGVVDKTKVGQPSQGAGSHSILQPQCPHFEVAQTFPSQDQGKAAVGGAISSYRHLCAMRKR